MHLPSESSRGAFRDSAGPQINTVLDQLDSLLAQAPHAPALDGALQLSRLELREDARRTAHLLAVRGVNPGDVVGVLGTPSSAAIVRGFWGVLAAGAVYLPLDAEWNGRTAEVLARAECHFVLVELGLAERARAQVGPGVEVIVLAEVDWDGPPPERPAGPPAGGLAYLVPSSGSTGNPKLIEITHPNLLAQMRAQSATLRLGPGTRFLFTTRPTFDPSIAELAMPAIGATLITSDRDLAPDAAYAVEQIRRHRVTAIQTSPHRLALLVADPGFARCTSLRVVFVGGDKLFRDLARRVDAALPGRRLVNLWGPAECTVNTSFHRVTKANRVGDEGSVPIGGPLGGTRFYLRDEAGALVEGVGVGRLLLSGELVGRGYRGDRARTDAAFLPNPYTTDPGHAVLYDTGDVVARLADGTYEVRGRANDIVKINGERVDLAELRSEILMLDWIRDAHATVLRRGTRDLLVAFIELDSDQAPLMDPTHPADHHVSKRTGHQASVQRKRLWLLDPAQDRGLPRVTLPGCDLPAEELQRIFARKSYRYYEGAPLTRADLETFVRDAVRAAGRVPSIACPLTEHALGSVLRAAFGAFELPGRPLPRRPFASAGGLNAVQVYFEIPSADGAPGLYFYDPATHQGVRLGDSDTDRIRITLVGKHAAIESVYVENVPEVFDFEAGHARGALDEALAPYGLSSVEVPTDPDFAGRLRADTPHHPIVTLELHAVPAAPRFDGVVVRVQVHGSVSGIEPGIYTDVLDRLTEQVVRRRDVIALNQPVYERAQIGLILLAAGNTPADYRALGRAAHFAQAGGRIGFMPSGYSSRTGTNLPSANRLGQVLGRGDGVNGASYFLLGGPVSDTQRAGSGINEDRSLQSGPKEILHADLRARLGRGAPALIEIGNLPRLAAGKIDRCALENRLSGMRVAECVPPNTETEAAIARVVGNVLREPVESVTAPWIDLGLDSLSRLSLIDLISRELGVPRLGHDALDTWPTIQHLARAVDRGLPAKSGVIHLGGVVEWYFPGLGGSARQLQPLARGIRGGRLAEGLQCLGFDPTEPLPTTLDDLVAHDLAKIRERQPNGPYRLVGFSFGCRRTFVVAQRLEADGAEVEAVILVAPGSPAVPGHPERGEERKADYADPAFVATLFSVFAGSLDDPRLASCLQRASSREHFLAFALETFGGSAALLDRQVALVERCYQMTWRPAELAAIQLSCPVYAFAALGDEPSFLDRWTGAVVRVPLPVGHFAALTDPAAHARILDTVDHPRQLARMSA